MEISSRVRTPRDYLIQKSDACLLFSGERWLDSMASVLREQLLRWLDLNSSSSQQHVTSYDINYSFQQQKPIYYSSAVWYRVE